MMPRRKHTQEERWQKHFRELMAYQQADGRMPFKPFRQGENPQLYGWCVQQRVFYRLGKLRAERVAQLEAVGFRWEGPSETSEKRMAKWEQRFQQLLAFREASGDSKLSMVNNMGDRGLECWVRAQRRQREKGKLPLDWEVRLDAAGFLWVCPAREVLMQWREAMGSKWGQQVYGVSKSKEVQQLWQRRFEELVAFKESYGHCLVQSTWSENPALGRWVAAQRSHYKCGNLSLERQEQLEAVGFVWDVKRIKRRLEVVKAPNAHEDCYCEQGEKRIVKSDAKQDGDERDRKRAIRLSIARQMLVESKG